jgi:hypothetical protein
LPSRSANFAKVPHAIEVDCIVICTPVVYAVRLSHPLNVKSRVISIDYKDFVKPAVLGKS